jgi:RNA polymerase sigma-70 factor (ECF subfamily)
VLAEEHTVNAADRQALDKLFQKHRGEFLAFVRRRMSPTLAVRADAEDIVTEAYIRAYNGWPDFRPPDGQFEGACCAWLKRIVWNCYQEVWNRHHADKRTVDRGQGWPDSSSLLEALGVVNPGTGPISKAVRHELEHRLEELLGRLEKKDQTILTLRDLENRSYAEVAEALGISERNIRVYRLRALRRLCDLWKQTYPSDWQRA